MLTASHNPPQYNGYKVYWEDGGQIVPPQDIEIIDQIKKTQFVNILSKPKESLIEIISDDLDKAFIKAALQSGHNFLEDFNGPLRTGVSRVDSTVHKGIRQSSALAYLKKIPKNLHIFTNTHISRILFEQTRAVGIESTKGDKFFADQEVIICQGAFGTPQLLMLSGIGPSDHLLSHGIKPIMDLQGVGQNLADHIDVSIQYGSRSMDLSAAKYQRLDKAALLMGKWLLNGSGPGGGSLFSTVLFHCLLYTSPSPRDKRQSRMPSSG